MSHTIDPPEEVKSDMTPMIDVVFLMIIFFVCIEFKVLESKLPAYLPRDRGSRPVAVVPQEQLSVRVHVDRAGSREAPPGHSLDEIDPNTGRPLRYRLVDHRVRWEVGPKQLDDLTAVQHELARIAKDPASLVPDDKTGGRKLMACVVEGLRGTCYDDIARTTDACHAAGFAEINFGGGIDRAR